MPQIDIRPTIAADIPSLIALDHNYISDHVWQISVDEERENPQVSIHFREVRLPRSIRVEYPHPRRSLADNWTTRDGLLSAILENELVGYAGLYIHKPTRTTWMADLVVGRPFRHQGIGSALVIAAMEWAIHMDCRYMVLEMQHKNYPAIQLAKHLGFDFCGYNDLYYSNHEIGLFFSKVL